MRHFFYAALLCGLSTHTFSADTQYINISIKKDSNISTTIEPNSTNLQIDAKPLVFRNSTNPNCQQVHLAKFKTALIQAINEIRKQPRQCGAQYHAATNALTWNNTLEKSSYQQAQDLSNRKLLSHTNISGLRLKERLSQVGYQGVTGGENLASGQKTVNQVLNDWMTLSPSHCSNIMTNSYSDYALACVTNPNTGRTYWVQQFGKKN